MIALDSSAIVAIAKGEPEERSFANLIVAERALISAPTLLEIAMVLCGKMPTFAEQFLDGVLGHRQIEVVAFSLDMYRAAADAFRRFGKGQGHPAGLNYGDCMSYAVARVHDVPLLYKGDDFARTDIRPAIAP